MKTCIYLLSFVSHALAARWIVDPSYDNWPKDAIKEGAQEAFDLADNALNVMKDHASDDKVQSMARCMLGTINYQANWDNVKKTLEKVLEYEKEPSPFSSPQDPQWTSIRNNKDVEFYCDSSRLVRKKRNNRVFALDPAQGNRKYREEQLEVYDFCDAKKPDNKDKILGFTTTSDQFDKKGYNEAKDRGENPKRKDYLRETEFANVIQLCKWYMKEHDKDDWFQVDEKSIELMKANSEAIKTKSGNTVAPIDALRTVGGLILHELTHTNQVGELSDLELPNDKVAYGWKKCGSIENPGNSDTVAMLALALKVWSTGKYYVGDSGDILTR